MSLLDCRGMESAVNKYSMQLYREVRILNARSKYEHQKATMEGVVIEQSFDCL